MPPISFTRTRLAPSPTGALHLGHARTFLITWWLARQARAQIVMRMEDLDTGRAKPESVQQAYDDLRWLGIDWDGNIIVQSSRLHLYAAALEQLWADDKIYPCTCRRADIAAAVAGAASAPHDTDVSIRYPGTCSATRHATFGRMNIADTVATIRGATGKEVCWRLRVPPGEIRFDDALAGPQSFDVATDSGDFPLTRFDGTSAYQLAVVVDDHDLAIDMVIRGDDLLSSTPRQLHLYHALGWKAPAFAHAPLVVGTDGKRLAKRHGESRIAQFRAAAVPPEKIVGWSAWRSGQISAPQPLSAKDLIKTFDHAKIPPTRITLTATDLAFLT
jgi:glutamyl-tRNA synthetase